MAFIRAPMEPRSRQTPAGLWTLDVSTGARCLLGWLHSHTDAFLAEVTLNRARRAMGTSSIAKWLAELVTAGLVSREGRDYRLEVEAWEALFDRRTASRNRPSPKAAHRAETGSITEPKPGCIVVQENSRETDEEELSLLPELRGCNTRRVVEVVAPDDDLFDRFWLAYPRKVGKPDARKAFKRALGKAPVLGIGTGLKRWRAYWVERGDPEFIPHPSTWLNQERWNDLPPEAAANLSPGGRALRRLAVRREEARR